MLRPTYSIKKSDLIIIEACCVCPCCDDVTKVIADEIDNKLIQCSYCWETFKVKEDK